MKIDTTNKHIRDTRVPLLQLPKIHHTEHITIFTSSPVNHLHLLCISRRRSLLAGELTDSFSHVVATTMHYRGGVRCLWSAGYAPSSAKEIDPKFGCACHLKDRESYWQMCAKGLQMLLRGRGTHLCLCSLSHISLLSTITYFRYLRVCSHANSSLGPSISAQVPD